MQSVLRQPARERLPSPGGCRRRFAPVTLPSLTLPIVALSVLASFVAASTGCGTLGAGKLPAAATTMSPSPATFTGAASPGATGVAEPSVAYTGPVPLAAFASARLPAATVAGDVPEPTVDLDQVQGPLKLKPSNDRDWEPSLAVLPRADFAGDQVTVKNIRRFTYLGEYDYVMNYYDRTFDLKQLRTVDFIIVPFKNSPSLAHTMLSFGWQDGRQLVVSVEVRLEQGQEYSALLGALHQYEITYVLGDERDLILLRTEHRDVDVHLYPTRAEPEQVRELFVDVMRRVNKLEQEPEFYDTLTNNCTTNIVQHINTLYPGRIPWDIRWVLPGYSDRLAYDLGLLDTSLPFEETRRRARINELARRYRDDPNFSQRIRGQKPPGDKSLIQDSGP